MAALFIGKTCTDNKIRYHTPSSHPLLPILPPTPIIHAIIYQPERRLIEGIFHRHNIHLNWGRLRKSHHGLYLYRYRHIPSYLYSVSISIHTTSQSVSTTISNLIPNSRIAKFGIIFACAWMIFMVHLPSSSNRWPTALACLAIFGCKSSVNSYLRLLVRWSASLCPTIPAILLLWKYQYKGGKLPAGF